MKIDNLCINTLRINGVAAVNEANSGHPGIVIGAAPIIHTLYSRHINFNPNDTQWVNRDRFILSAGHGSALLYAQLRLLGILNKNDLKKFRQWNSLTPGHPEYGHTKGVDSTSGPLGQGIAIAVGMAIAEQSLASKFSEINHFTYVICGDGDLQEGVANEAISFAGKQQLSKLIILHDSNKIQLDTPVNKVFNEDLKRKFESQNWDYQKVANPTVENIDKAIINAKKSDKPSFIEVKTIIGEGTTKQGTSSVHGAPLGDDIHTVVKYFNWKEGLFDVPKEVHEFYLKIIEKSKKKYNSFKPSKKLKEFLNKKSLNIKLDIKENIATRASSGEVIQYLNKNLPNWIGGSADLVASTKAQGGDGDFQVDNRKGRNILFGVREFAMGGIANGIALHSNFKPFVSTFFVFSDYLKPAMRLSALMNLPVTYIFTHDSIFVGEDGPTHQPIEQLAMLRSIPNLVTIRPCDEREVIGAYNQSINSKNPTAIVLTRQNIKSTKLTKNNISKGGYKIFDAKSNSTIIATGSEVALALEVAKELNMNVVSMPSMELFEKQNQEYKNQIIFNNINKNYSLELASTFGWSKFAKFNFGIDTFGYSAPGNLVYEKIGFTKENIIKWIKDCK